jgi:hypothetical protein
VLQRNPGPRQKLLLAVKSKRNVEQVSSPLSFTIGILAFSWEAARLAGICLKVGDECVHDLGEVDICNRDKVGEMRLDPLGNLTQIIFDRVRDWMTWVERGWQRLRMTIFSFDNQLCGLTGSNVECIEQACTADKITCNEKGRPTVSF